MVFTRKDGDFHGRTVSLPEGNSEKSGFFHPAVSDDGHLKQSYDFIFVGTRPGKRSHSDCWNIPIFNRKFSIDSIRGPHIPLLDYRSVITFVVGNLYSL